MRAQRVDKILVTDGTQAASVAALGPLDFVVLVQGEAANTPIEDKHKFQIVVEKSNGQVKYSDVIKAKDIVSVKLAPYAAVVEQEVEVTLGTPEEGQEYLLTIVDKSDKEILQRRQDKRSYQVLAGAGETATTLGDKFAALINGDAGAPVTAVNAAGVITLTAKPKVVTQNDAGQFGLQHYFEAGLTQVNQYGHYIEWGSVETTVEPGFGNGTFAQVRELEQFSAGYDEGRYLNRILFPIPTPSFDSVAGTNYDLLVIEYDNQYNSNSVVFGKRVADPITLVLAVTAGQTAALETIFANYLPAAEEPEEPETP